MSQNYLNSAQSTANSAFGPYVGSSSEDFNNYRQYGYNAVSGLQGETGGQDPAEWMNQDIGMNPDDIYNQLMSGWTMSVGAQQQLNQELDAANNLAEESGMLGSEENITQNMEIAQKIVAQDQQRYLHDIKGINNQQMGWLKGYRGEQKGLGHLFQNINKTEFDASRDLSDLTYRIQNSSQRQENQQKARQGKSEKKGIGLLAGALGFLI